MILTGKRRCSTGGAGSFGHSCAVCRSPPEVPQAVKSNTLVNTVVTDVHAEVKKPVSKKPESLEEYLPVGRYYAAKKTFAGAPDRGDPASDPVF